MARRYKQRERTDVLDRILARIEREGECWIFAGSKHPQGYGQVHNPGGSRLVHVIVYQRMIGPVPEDMELDHLCRREACCNPAHLEPVTHGENVRRGRSDGGRANRAKTHCPQNHPYDEANTRWYRGGRRCRACDRERHAAARVAVA